MTQTGTATRGIRGAIDLPDDEAGSVDEAVRELLDGIREQNGCDPADVAAVMFTVTDDLPRANPAAPARAAGWREVPLFVVREHGGDSRVARCIRVLVLWNTDRAQSDIRHVYLREAAGLRPDLQPATREKGGAG